MVLLMYNLGKKHKSSFSHGSPSSNDILLQESVVGVGLASVRVDTTVTVSNGDWIESVRELREDTRISAINEDWMVSIGLIKKRDQDKNC